MATERWQIIIIATLLALCGWRDAWPTESKAIATMPAIVFYSQADPRWPETEKVIAAVEKKYPQLHVVKIAIDDLDGYQKLVAMEKNLNIQPTGEVTLIMDGFFLTSQGERRDIEKQFGLAIEHLLHPDKNNKGRRPANIGDYAREFFGKDAQVEPKTKDIASNTVYYQVKKDARQVGWVVDVFREIYCPVCADAQFLAAIESLNLKTLDIRPILPLERLTGAIAKEEIDQFTTQFKDRAEKDIEQRVQIIPGAEKISHAYEAAMNEIMQTLKGSRFKVHGSRLENTPNADKPQPKRESLMISD